MEPIIKATNRFLRSYHRASPNLQEKAEGSLHDFVRFFHANPITCIRNYEQVKNLRNCTRHDRTNTDIREFEISGGERMLCDWSFPTLTLVDLGNHSLIKQSKCTEVKKALESIYDAPSQFFPQVKSGFFVKQTSNEWRTFGSELQSDWIYYLDEEQHGIVESIYNDSITILLTAGYYRINVIIGGPGTGKTCILLNLLKRYYNEGGIKVQFVVSDEVSAYLRASTQVNIEPFVPEAPIQSKCDVLLVDDPSSIYRLKEVASYGQNGLAKVIVLAFDPLQLEDALSDDDYREYITSHQVGEYVLHTCYRQKEHVGTVTKAVVDSIARSTPFLADDKQKLHWLQHQRLTELSNNLRFVNPFGYSNFHDQATWVDLQHEISELKRQPGGLWAHCPPLLVALVDESLQRLPNEWLQTLGQSRVEYRLATVSELQHLKGVEFQHVFAIVGRTLWGQLNGGFSGSGRKTYNQRRLLRIPFSRAKDRLVVFAL